MRLPATNFADIARESFLRSKSPVVLPKVEDAGDLYPMLRACSAIQLLYHLHMQIALSELLYKCFGFH